MVTVPKWYTVHPLCHGSWKQSSILFSPVFGHWCDKAAVGCITSLGYSQGESPWCCCACVSVCVFTEREECHHWAPCHCASNPLPQTPALACTLTYSWSRFGDTKIKAFLCFSLSLLSSFSSVTRALSAGALAVDIESSFKLTQPLFTSALW